MIGKTRHGCDAKSKSRLLRDSDFRGEMVFCGHVVKSVCLKQHLSSSGAGGPPGLASDKPAERAARDPPLKSRHFPTPTVLSSGMAAFLRLAPVRLPSWEYPAIIAGNESCVRALTHAHSGSFRAQNALAGCGDCGGWGVFVDFVEFPYRSGCCGPIYGEEIPFFRGFACSLANRDEIRIKSDLAGGDLRQRP